MLVRLTLILIFTSLALTTSIVMCWPDANKHVDSKPCADDELTIKCTKLSEPHGANIDQKRVQAEQKNTSKVDPIVALMDEISRLKQELIPEEASMPTKTKKVRLAGADVRVSNQSARNSSDGQTICEKSLAVGTLGYRILCQPNKKTLAAQRQEKHKQQSQEMMTRVASSVTKGGVATLRERPDLPEQAEAGELRRLRSLLEQLDKRGNFRPIVQSS